MRLRFALELMFIPSAQLAAKYKRTIMLKDDAKLRVDLTRTDLPR